LFRSKVTASSGKKVELLGGRFCNIGDMFFPGQVTCDGQPKNIYRLTLCQGTVIHAKLGYISIHFGADVQTLSFGLIKFDQVGVTPFSDGIKIGLDCISQSIAISHELSRAFKGGLVIK
jgi:hypothetical protein